MVKENKLLMHRSSRDMPYEHCHSPMSRTSSGIDSPVSSSFRMSESSASRLEANASPRDSGNRSLSRSPNYQLTWSRSRSRSPTSQSRYSRSSSPPSRSPPARRMEGHVRRSRSPVDRGNGQDDTDWKNAEREILKKEYELEQLRARVTYAKEMENERKKQQEMRKKLERLQAGSPARIGPAGSPLPPDHNNNRRKYGVHHQSTLQQSPFQMRDPHSGNDGGGGGRTAVGIPNTNASSTVSVQHLNASKPYQKPFAQQKRVSKFDSPKQNSDKPQSPQNGSTSFALSPLGYQFGADGILYYDAAMAEAREAELEHLSPEEYCGKLGVQSEYVTNRVYVRNLDYRVTHEQLFQIFSMVGKVRNVTLKTNSETGKNLGTALVYYYDRKCTVRAIAVLHDLKMFDRKIKVVMGNPPGSRNVPLNTQIGQQSAHASSEVNINKGGNSHDYDTRGSSEYYSTSSRSTSQIQNYSPNYFAETSNTLPLPMVIEDNEYGPPNYETDSSSNVLYRSPTHKTGSRSVPKPAEFYDPATRSVEQLQLPPPLMSIPVKTPPLPELEKAIIPKSSPPIPTLKQPTATPYPLAEALFSQNPLPIPTSDSITGTGAAAAAAAAAPAQAIAAPALQLLQNYLSAALEQQALSIQNTINQQSNPTPVPSGPPIVPPVASLPSPSYNISPQQISPSQYPPAMAADSGASSIRNLLQGKINVILGDKATPQQERNLAQQFPRHLQHQQQQHVPQQLQVSLPVVQQPLPPMASQPTMPTIPDTIDCQPNDTYALPWDSYVQRGMVKNRFPILVTNLPATCHQSTLREYFDQHVGEVLHVEIERDPANDHLAVATVFFHTPALALKAFNTQNRHFICGRQVDIKYAVE